MKRPYVILSIALFAALAACSATQGGSGQSSSSSSADSSAVAMSSVSSASYVDQIQVTSPLPGATIASPLAVSGTAKGTWYFEASFPITLKDANGKVLGQTPGQAQGDWMTTDFVPFSAVLTFTPSTTPTGTLVLQNDNPSGDPTNQKEVDIPVRF